MAASNELRRDRARHLSMACAAVAAAVVLALATDGPRDRRQADDGLPAYFTSHHADMLVYHLRGDAALPPGRWLFFGDSLVQGMPVGALGVPAVNYGIGGDDARGIAARLPSHRSATTAAAVVLSTGINDLARGDPASALADWRALLDVVSGGSGESGGRNRRGGQGGPRVVCLATLPVDERVGAPGSGRRPQKPGRTNAAVLELNAGIERECRARGHDFVPFPPELAGPDGNLRADLHTGDGVHLGPAGYALWLARLGPALEALAASSAPRSVVPPAVRSAPPGSSVP